VERNWAATSFGKYCGRMCDERAEELLEGIGEDDLVVLP
jgi:hypothetical protein